MDVALRELERKAISGGEEDQRAYEQALRRVNDHSKCYASSVICGQITFGRGRLDNNGYWEIPCRECAERFAETNPEYDVCIE